MYRSVMAPAFPAPGLAPAGVVPIWVVPTPGTELCDAELSPPATKMWPSMVTAAAPLKVSGRCPTTEARRCAVSIIWMSSIG